MTGWYPRTQLVLASRILDKTRASLAKLDVPAARKQKEEICIYPSIRKKTIRARHLVERFTQTKHQLLLQFFV